MNVKYMKKGTSHSIFLLIEYKIYNLFRNISKRLMTSIPTDVRMGLLGSSSVTKFCITFSRFTSLNRYITKSLKNLMETIT